MFMIVQDLESSVLVSQHPNGGPLATASAIPQSAGGSDPTEVEYFDANTIESSSATVWNDWLVFPNSDVTLTNETPLVGSLDATTHAVTRIGDGPVRIRATKRGAKSWLNLNVTQVAGATAREFVSYVSDSVADRITNEVIDRLLPGKSITMFSTRNHIAGTYVRDTNNWAADLDLSGVGIALKLAGGSWSQANAPHAITPRHAVAARHWGFNYSTGSMVRFVSNTGAVVERTIIGVSESVPGGYGSFDSIVFTLDSDLPASVVPLKIAGEWLRQGKEITDAYGPYSAAAGQYYSSGLCFAINQRHELVVMMAGHGIGIGKNANYVSFSLTYNGGDFGDVMVGFHMRGGAHLEAIGFSGMDGKYGFTQDIVSGDSGKPVIAIIEGEPVLLSAFFGSSYGVFHGRADGDVINAEISSADAAAGISTGYTVTVAPDPTA